MSVRLVLAKSALDLPFRELVKIQPDAVEVEWLNWSALPETRKRTLARQLTHSLPERILTVPARWLSPALEPEVLHERTESLQYWADRLNVSRVHAISSEGFEPEEQVHSLITHWEMAAGSASDSSRMNTEVLDPFHHFGTLRQTTLPLRIPKQAPRNAYWKIHGWHPDRWVRRYGDEALSRLAKWMQKTQATHLCFAHSQRVAQLQEFRTLLRTVSTES